MRHTLASGPPEEWYHARTFFVYTPEEQRAREAFDMSDLFEDENTGDVEPDDLPGLAVVSDSDSDTDDEGYRSEEEDKDSEREDTDTSVPAPIIVSMPVAATVLQGERAGDLRMAPTMQIARDAHNDLSALLKPARTTGKGYRNADLDLGLRTRLEWMKIFLWVYVDESNDLVRDSIKAESRWIAASLRAATTAQKGVYFSRRLREWTRAFIANRKALPLTNHRGTKSILEREDVAQEIALHLQSLGKWIRALDIVQYTSRPEVKARLKLKKTISLATAKIWMGRMGYRWKKDPAVQYIDGHERDDVVYYRQTVFLPLWSTLEVRLRSWTADNIEVDRGEGGRRIVVWFHDESTFYANDRRKVRWVKDGETAVPRAKGEGPSLMVADLVSADYGWLASPDGTETARRLFRAGKNREGYFTSDDIIAQANAAMSILSKYYPDDDHVLVFDNASTHLKRANDALSAKQMPKGISKPGANWGVWKTVMGENGMPLVTADGKPQKTKVRMTGGMLHDGSPQSFYFPEGHEHAGLFKGMSVILAERGLVAQSKLKAMCGTSLKLCKPGEKQCCCRRTMFNEPDFAAVKPLLQIVCEDRGFRCIFLPKFHCEMNFIEQCWCAAKRTYRMYPTSSKEADLEANLISALASVSLVSMRR